MTLGVICCVSGECLRETAGCITKLHGGFGLCPGGAGTGCQACHWQRGAGQDSCPVVVQVDPTA